MFILLDRTVQAVDLPPEDLYLPFVFCMLAECSLVLTVLPFPLVVQLHNLLFQHQSLLVEVVYLLIAHPIVGLELVFSCLQRFYLLQ